MSILAGDVGATHARLRLVRDAVDGPTIVREARLLSRDFNGLSTLLQTFLRPDDALQAVALGIAAPVIDGNARFTNLPWPNVSEAELQRLLQVPVRLLNDLEAMASGVLTIAERERHVLQAGTRREGPLAVIAPGTGLGQAIVWQAHGQTHVQATEGGHVDFAPQEDVDVALWQFARAEWQHVSWERVVSGPGLHVIWRCLTERLGEPACAGVQTAVETGADVPAIIGQHGVSGACPSCGKAVRWLVRLLGAQAGNLALTVWSVGGVYLAGGLTEHLWPILHEGPFLQAFQAKGRYESVMRQMPVYALRDAALALNGATQAGLTLARAGVGH